MSSHFCAPTRRAGDVGSPGWACRVHNRRWARARRPRRRFGNCARPPNLGGHGNLARNIDVGVVHDCARNGVKCPSAVLLHVECTRAHPRIGARVGSCGICVEGGGDLATEDRPRRSSPGESAISAARAAGSRLSGHWGPHPAPASPWHARLTGRHLSICDLKVESPPTFELFMPPSNPLARGIGTLSYCRFATFLNTYTSEK